MNCELLTDNNFVLYAMKHYNNPSCRDVDEFDEDIKKFKYIKKLVTRYIETDKTEIKERLILNHLIILNNVFGPHHLNRMVLLKLREQLCYVKPFLVFMNIYHNKIKNVNVVGVFDMDLVVMDTNIVNILRKI